MRANIRLSKKLNFLALLHTASELIMDQNEVPQNEVPQNEVKFDTIDVIVAKATEKGFDSKFDPDTGATTFEFTCSRVMPNGRQFSACVSLKPEEKGVELFFWAHVPNNGEMD